MKKLNLFTFNTSEQTHMKYIFSGFSEQFKMEIKAKYPNIKEEAFVDHN